MTTVVGIMIVILIVVQLGADSAVKEYVEREKAANSQKLEEDAMKHYLKQKATLLEQKQNLQMSMAQKQGGPKADPGNCGSRKDFDRNPILDAQEFETPAVDSSRKKKEEDKKKDHRS